MAQSFRLRISRICVIIPSPAPNPPPPLYGGSPRGCGQYHRAGRPQAACPARRTVRYPRHDRALRAQAGHVARLALAGREVGGLGKVVKDRLRLLPLGNACLSLTHAVVLDVRVLRRLGRLARIVLQVLVVEDETFLKPGIIVVQVVDLPVVCNSRSIPWKRSAFPLQPGLLCLPFLRIPA